MMQTLGKGGEDYIGRGISEWGELLEKWYKQDFLPYLEKNGTNFRNLKIGCLNSLNGQESG